MSRFIDVWALGRVRRENTCRYINHSGISKKSILHLQESLCTGTTQQTVLSPGTRESERREEVRANLAKKKRGHSWRAGWLSCGEIGDISPVCHQSVSPWRIYFERTEEEGEGGKSSEVEQEATLPGIKLLYVCISFLASPAGTPKPPGAICSCCFISHSNQRGQKEPANKDPTNRLSERSCQVRQSRGHLQDFFFSSSSPSSSSWPHAEIKGLKE